ENGGGHGLQFGFQGEADFIQRDRVVLEPIFGAVSASRDGSQTYQNIQAQLFGDVFAGGTTTYLGGKEVLAVQGGGGALYGNLNIAGQVSLQLSTDCGQTWQGGAASSLTA